MTKERMPQSESESYAGQPPSMPMPEYPIPRAAVSAMPMPTRMPAQDASSFVRSQRPTSEETKVIAMDDYPVGRGGMRMMPMPRAEQPAQPAVRPDAPIGTKPPAIKMPTNP